MYLKFTKGNSLNQWIAILKNCFSRFQYSFRKGHCAQDCQMTITEKWKTSRKKESKLLPINAVDCFPNDPIIANPNGYGLDFQLQKLVQSFLSNIKHKTKMNNTYCSLEELLLVFCKLLSSGHFHLVSSYAISFQLSIIWVLEVMLMITNHITIYYNRLCKTGRWKHSSNKLSLK